MDRTTSFAPELFIPRGTTNVSFYEKAFGAKERMRFQNDDGSIHVVEFDISDAIFHIHEVTSRNNFTDPVKMKATTVCIGLFVQDVDEVVNTAVASGAELIEKPRDYEYGYRQATIKDPFGHYWQIQKRI